MKSITVFCGSKEGYNEVYRETAYALGAALADKGIRLVFGGGKIGLMGAVAEGVLQNNGEVVGVIPDFLSSKEVAHDGLTEMITVKTMHERKLKMHELSDAAITLPGGLGTMDEMFELLTWGQLGLHNKPMGLLNINGFYDSLKVLMNNMVDEGFLQECTRDLLLISDSIDELFDMLNNYTPPETEQILNRETT